MNRVIETVVDLADLIAKLEVQPRPFTVKVTEGRLHSVQQNAVQWMWATEASRQRQDVRPQDVQAEWKLAFGVPILKEDPDFASTWAKIEAVFTYEEQLELVHHFEVTSVMTVKQFKEYLDQVQQWNLEHGIELTDPETLRYDGAKRTLPYTGSFDR